MAFTEKEIQRLRELHQQIEERKGSHYALPTFRDVPALNGMEAVAVARLAADEEKPTLFGGAAVFSYVALCFADMGRAAVASRKYRRALEICARYGELYGERVPNVRDFFYDALRARNVYVDDDCEDLAALCAGVLGDDEIRTETEAVKKRRRSYRQDPVEMTEAYLSVIDEVDERVERAREGCGRGTCFERWNLKRKYLEEHGVEWRSPAVLNPGVHFD